MIRSLRRWSWPALLGLVAIAWVALDGKARDPGRSGFTVARVHEASPAKDDGPGSVAALLRKPVKFSGFDDPKTTLREALEHLTKRFDIPVDVNEAAFKAENINDPLSVPVAERPIPKLLDVPLDVVLRKVLAPLPVPAAYLVRADGIEITTEQAQRAEVWGPNATGPYLPLVHATFDKQPLDKALRELAEQAGMSVVLDVRAGDKAQTPVTATLTNTPLDTAVRLLADMAGLQTALNDNVLYVTNGKHAVKLRPDPEAEVPTGGAGISGALGFAGGFGFGGGVLGAGGGFGGGSPLSVPVKNAKFDKKPVKEAIQEVLDSTGFKLVVDRARVGDKVTDPVTADLDNVPLETVVRLLADMAGLKPVILDNVVYLTTKKNARELQEELDRRSQDAMRMLGLGGVGSTSGKRE